jgi:DNA mismatch repair protein MutS
VRVKEWKGEVVFLHEIVEGSADHSYGIHVARLAGLPPSVIDRAREVLRQLEETERKSPVHAMIDDLPLFSILDRDRRSEQQADPVAEILDALSPDEMTPKEALEALYRLKAAASRRS